MSFKIKDGVMFKKVAMSDPKQEFLKLSKDVEKQFRKRLVVKKDVSKAVQWARRR